jgi:hypothetical protein
MASFGNNMKIHVAASRKDEVRAFYVDVLSCAIQSPMDSLDLLQFADGFNLAVDYIPEADGLAPEIWKRAPWIEIFVADLESVKSALADSGFTPFEFSGTDHDYFAGPGGLVFRLAQQE